MQTQDENITKLVELDDIKDMDGLASTIGVTRQALDQYISTLNKMKTYDRLAEYGDLPEWAHPLIDESVKKNYHMVDRAIQDTVDSYQDFRMTGTGQ